jgi:hypothetical protein
MRSTRRLSGLLTIAAAAALTGCDGGEIDTGASIERIEEGLSGCHGVASSSVPSSGNYYLTSFGGGSDSGTMSCGQNTSHGSWYYAASRQRYGCGAHLRVEANGKCVIVAADDYGPDVCVENAAGGPILDASPLVVKHLFGYSSAGWSDHFRVHVTHVNSATTLGPCDGSSGPPPPPPPTTCFSSTLDKHVNAGTCVQSASDAKWYHCSGGSWIGGESGCTVAYPWCHSDTLGRSVPARTCVQSKYDRVWYQCNHVGWDTPVSGGKGPVGWCSTEHAL